jgi:hypothetical protein
MKSVEIVLRSGGGGGGGRMMEGVNLRYVVITFVNITIYPLVQLVYANRNFKKKKKTSMY